MMKSGQLNRLSFSFIAVKYDTNYQQHPVLTPSFNWPSVCVVVFVPPTHSCFVFDLNNYPSSLEVETRLENPLIFTMTTKSGLCNWRPSCVALDAFDPLQRHWLHLHHHKRCGCLAVITSRCT